GSGGVATSVKDAAGIRLLGIDPGFRGCGAGKALALACIQRAREQGRSQVILHTTRAMTVAWGLYGKLGFVRSEDLDFQQDTLPVFGFRLRLSDGMQRMQRHRPGEQSPATGMRQQPLATVP